MAVREAIVLIGHGGVPSDCPASLVGELKRLEGERRARGEAAMGSREAELDRRVRTWPRSAETEPYHAGLEAVAQRLAARMAPRRLVVAYNEFCAPSVEEAIASLVRDGVERIVLATTMFTPGGSHSELEIAAAARRAHPGVDVRYAWPFDLDRAADFLAEQIDRS